MGKKTRISIATDGSIEITQTTKVVKDPAFTGKLIFTGIGELHEDPRFNRSSHVAEYTTSVAAVYGAFLQEGLFIGSAKKQRKLLERWERTGQGCIELVMEATSHLENIWECLQKHAGEEHLGVFEYEVVSAYGSWLREQIMASDDGELPPAMAALTKIEELVEAFFDPDKGVNMDGVAEGLSTGAAPNVQQVAKYVLRCKVLGPDDNIVREMQKWQVYRGGVFSLDHYARDRNVPVQALHHADLVREAAALLTEQQVMVVWHEKVNFPEELEVYELRAEVGPIAGGWQGGEYVVTRTARGDVLSNYCRHKDLPEHQFSPASVAAAKAVVAGLADGELAIITHTER